MAWVRSDDRAKDNRRVLRSGIGGFLNSKALKVHRSREMERCAVFGFVALCVAWSAGDYSDLFIPDYVAYDVGGPDSEWMVAAAIKAGLFAEKSIDEANGDEGWQVVDNGDNLFHVRTKDEVLIDRNKSQTSRLSLAMLEVQARDGDQCRYCGRSVTHLLPKQGGDNASLRARNLDHVDPLDPKTDVVVACRGCNLDKSQRTPEQAGMTLLLPPEERGAEVYYHPKTITTFNELGYGHLLRIKANQEQDQSKTKASARQGQDQSVGGVKSAATPGRGGRSGLVGPAQDGSGQADVRPLRPVHDDDPGGAA